MSLHHYNFRVDAMKSLQALGDFLVADEFLQLSKHGKHTTGTKKQQLPINFLKGLPTSEEDAVCRAKFSNEVAKLTILISDPNVMTIKRNIKNRFPDQVGVVGKMCLDRST